MIYYYSDCVHEVHHVLFVSHIAFTILTNMARHIVLWSTFIFRKLEECCQFELNDPCRWRTRMRIILSDGNANQTCQLFLHSATVHSVLTQRVFVKLRVLPSERKGKKTEGVSRGAICHGLLLIKAIATVFGR